MSDEYDVGSRGNLIRAALAGANLRIEALRLAHGSLPSRPAEEIVKRAQAYYEFLKETWDEHRV